MEVGQADRNMEGIEDEGEKVELAAKMAVACEILEEEEQEEKLLCEKEEAEDVGLRCLVEEEMGARPTSRRWCVRPLNTTRPGEGEWGLLVAQMRRMDEEKHFIHFRMSASRFDDLLRRVEPLIRHASTHSMPISPAERLAVTVSVLASGASHQMAATNYRMGHSTVCGIISEVSEAIWLALKGEFVAFPSAPKFREIAVDFWNLWNFPNCVGAIDGKHVNLQAPGNAGSDFHNYKGHHSIVLMAVCDARYRFTMVDIGAYGRESDGGVFQDSAFGSGLQSGEIQLPPPEALPGRTIKTPHVFVGDAAFPMLPNLMSPYSSRNLTEEKRIYNYRHSRARRIIENTFGILAARWRILGRPLECTPEKAGHIVHACVALHNYLTCTDAANSAASRYLPANFPDVTTASGDEQPGEWRRQVEGDTNLQDPARMSNNRKTTAGKRVRGDFTEYFMTPQGLVPWQGNVVRRGRLNV